MVHHTIEYADRGIFTYGDAGYDPADPPQFPNRFAYQYWSLPLSDRYTPIYIDIVDRFNQLGTFYPGFGTTRVDDQMNGYSLPFIEANLVKHIYAINLFLIN